MGADYATYVAADNSTLVAEIGRLVYPSGGGLVMWNGPTMTHWLLADRANWINTGFSFGLGTSAPAASARLHVVGPGSGQLGNGNDLIRMQSAPGAWSTLHLTDGDSDAFIGYVPNSGTGTDGTQRYIGMAVGFTNYVSSVSPQFILNGLGRVGMGTTSPKAMLHIRDASSSTVTTPQVPTNFGLGALVERSADGLSASLAIVGGQKSQAGTGQLYLGNVDEWNSTMIEGGAGKMTFWVRNGGAAATAAMTINATGDLRVQGNIEAKYQDVAEWVPAGGALAPGTVVVLNRTRSNEVMPSAKSYDTAMTGVVSSRPGVLLGEAGDGKAKIATTGRVKVRVDATRHPVAIGDLLVSGEKPGLAMLSEPIDLGGVKIHRPGTILGKALEPLESGEGEILVLLSLQ
jgi:hypothetical protein